MKPCRLAGLYICSMAYIYNGELHTDEHITLSIYNRALNYGDGVFESMKYANNRINFWEDHYFRLMSSMRILRMEIPAEFSPEFLEEQLRNCVEANDLSHKAAKLRLLVFRKAGGLYTPETNEVDFIVRAEEAEYPDYRLNEKGLVVDLFKDFYKQEGLLSNLKHIGCALYTVASVFRKENELDECILLNDSKQVVETTSANLFLVKDNLVYTAPLEAGCLKGVMRRQVLGVLPKMGYEVREEVFSPFELQRADEIFITNASKGVQWVGQYRKKEYGNECSEILVKRLNVAAAIG